MVQPQDASHTVHTALRFFQREHALITDNKKKNNTVQVQMDLESSTWLQIHSAEIIEGMSAINIVERSCIRNVFREH